MLVWRFYIQDIKANGPWQLLKNYNDSDYEPEGWDAWSITLQRSDEYEGLENVYSDSLTFTDLPGLQMKSYFEQYGFDGQIGIKINSVCDDNIIDSIDAILNLSTYEEQNGDVSLKMEFSGFDRKFKNRLETIVDFNSNTSIDGLPLDPLMPKIAGLHSKFIKFQETYAIDGNDQFQIQTGVAGTQCYTLPGINNEVDEINGGGGGNSPFPVWSNAFNIINDNQDGIVALWKNDSDQIKTVTFKYDIEGSVKANGIGDTGHVANWYFSFAAQVTDQITFYSYVSGVSGPTTSPGAGEFYLYTPNIKVLTTAGPVLSGYDYAAQYTGINISNEITLIVNPGGSIWFYSHNTIISPNTNPQDTRIDFDFTKFDIKIIENSVISPTKTQGYLVYEALNRIIESYTGEKDSLRSDYYGRIDSYPHAYSNNGCGSHSLLTNGLNIRNMVDANGNKFPFKASFKDLYDTLNAIDNIGLRIETDSSGKQYVRIEPKEYFYNTEVFKTLENASDIKINVALEKTYNSFETGYATWQLTSITNNALDEFNSVHSYSMAVINSKTSLSKKSPYIASGYAIEFTRRKQYKLGVNDVFETDNNNFIIALNRDYVTSDLYGDGTATYPPNSISERDENFTVDTAFLLDPATSYNIRFSPNKMAMAWAKTLFASVYKSAKVLSFQSGEGNILERHLQNDECRISDQNIQQKDNIIDSSIVESQRNSLYLPRYISNEYPLTLSEFLDIKTNSNKCMAVSCSEEQGYKGFIKELVFQPAAEGGIGIFKLLEANA